MNFKTIIPSPLVEKFEKESTRGKALDIGAGYGDNALFLAQQGFSVVAVEIRKELIEIIKKRAEENKISLEIINQDVANFSIAENSCSFISAMNSLNFFSKKEFYDTIGKIKAGLISGGICVIALFTMDDQLFEEIKLKTINEDDGSFRNEAGKKWYFPKPNELKEIFEKDFQVLFYTEAIIDDNGHPNNPEPHQHAIARIAVKKEGSA